MSTIRGRPPPPNAPPRRRAPDGRIFRGANSAGDSAEVLRKRLEEIAEKAADPELSAVVARLGAEVQEIHDAIRVLVIDKIARMVGQGVSGRDAYLVAGIATTWAGMRAVSLLEDKHAEMFAVVLAARVAKRRIAEDAAAENQKL